MKRLFSRAVVCGIALAVQAAGAAAPGPAGERVVPVAAGVNKLVLNIPGTVTVRLDPAAAPSVRIRTERKVLGLVSVTVAPAQTLTIGAAGSFQVERPLQIDVVLRRLDAMEANGSADVTVERLDEPRFALNARGAGTIRLAPGRVRELSVRLDGAADVAAAELVAAQCTIAARGSGSTELHCSESVSGELSGSGELLVSGQPKRRAVRAGEASEVRFVK